MAQCLRKVAGKEIRRRWRLVFRPGAHVHSAHPTSFPRIVPSIRIIREARRTEIIAVAGNPTTSGARADGVHGPTLPQKSPSARHLPRGARQRS